MVHSVEVFAYVQLQAVPAFLLSFRFLHPVLEALCRREAPLAYPASVAVLDHEPVKKWVEQLVNRPLNDPAVEGEGHHEALLWNVHPMAAVRAEGEGSGSEFLLNPKEVAVEVIAEGQHLVPVPLLLSGVSVSSFEPWK